MAFHCHEVHHATFNGKVLAKIGKAIGRYSFPTGLWTSPSSVPFICVTAHWADGDWNTQHITVEFTKMEGSHTREKHLHQVRRGAAEVGAE